MSVLRLTLAALAGFGALAAAAAPAAAVDLTLTVDHARAIRLSEPAMTVIVGNPFIADVTPHDENMFLITGKSYGATNIIALDADGRQIYSAEVRVVGNGDGRLTVQRGRARESYHCAGACEHVAVAGDSPDAFGAALSTAMQSIDAASAQSQPE